MLDDEHKDATNYVVTDLMTALALAFLLAMGVSALLAGGLGLVSESLSAESRIAALEIDAQQLELEAQRLELEQQALKLAKLKVAEQAKLFLDVQWSVFLDNFSDDGVISADRGNGNLRFSEAVRFESDESRITNPDDPKFSISRKQMCAALVRLESTFLEQLENEQLHDLVKRSDSVFDFIEIYFEGFADRQGNTRDGRNWRLSSNRATELLIQFTIPESQAHTQTTSRSRPTNEAVAANRVCDDEDRINPKRVRVFASGRGSMDAIGPKDNWVDDRFAHIRMVIRMDKIISTLEEPQSN